MAKFKKGDKVVWLHFHSDSLSNETIKEVWKDGTYRVDSGLVSERELYPGHVAKEAEFVVGMRDIGGGKFASPHLPNKWFDLNGKVGTNAIRNAKFKVTDEVIYKGKHYLVHEVNGDKVKISDWEGDERTVGVNDPNLKALNACAVRTTNAVVAKALNACGTARNAKRVARNKMTEKMFGSVKVYFAPDNLDPLELKFVDSLDGEKTFGEVGEVLKDAEEYRSMYKARVAGLDKAIAWIKQNAK